MSRPRKTKKNDLDQSEIDTFLDAVATITPEDVKKEIKGRFVGREQSRKHKKHPSKASSPNYTEIDLHGFSVSEAREVIVNFISGIKLKHSEIKVRIITGKGLHSPEGRGVLFRDIFVFINSRFSSFIKTIDDPPWETALDGIPLRGYFEVVFVFKGKK